MTTTTETEELVRKVYKGTNGNPPLPDTQQQFPPYAIKMAEIILQLDERIEDMKETLKVECPKGDDGVRCASFYERSTGKADPRS